MATSGTYTFEQTRTEIIRAALIKIGVVAIENEGIPDAYQQVAADNLNRMLKAWQAEGIPLWKRQEATLFLAENTYKYPISLSSGHHTKTYVQTNTSAAATSGASSITVDSASGIVIGYYIGIYTAADDLQWFTVSNVVGTTITLNSTLSANVADNAVVFCYQTKINRPMRILGARRKTVDDIETSMEQLRHNDYMDFSLKTSATASNNFYYDKQLSTGYFYLEGVPSDVTDVIKITYQESIEDISADSQTLDIPQEWQHAIVLNLALTCIPDFQAWPLYEKIKPEAMEAKGVMQQWDSEEASIKFDPGCGY